MKKSNLLLMFIAVMTIGFMSSCDSETGDDLSPTLTLVTSGLDANNEIVEGSTYSVTVNAAQNVSSKKNLKELVITVPSVFDTVITINDESYTGLFNGIDAPAAGQSVTYTFRLEDRDGQIASESLTVTGTSAVTTNPITSYTAVLVGAQSNSTEGSAFASTNGQVYLKVDAATNSQLIDFVYFYGATNNATIAAPSDATVDGSASNSVDLTDTYTTKNATKLMSTSITPADFLAMTDDADFPTVSGNTTLVNNLSQGDVFAFETVTGKVGLVHVQAITTSATGSMTINVKVQD